MDRTPRTKRFASTLLVCSVVGGLCLCAVFGSILLVTTAAGQAGAGVPRMCNVSTAGVAGAAWNGRWVKAPRVVGAPVEWQWLERIGNSTPGCVVGPETRTAASSASSRPSFVLFVGHSHVRLLMFAACAQQLRVPTCERSSGRISVARGGRRADRPDWITVQVNSSSSIGGPTLLLAYAFVKSTFAPSNAAWDNISALAQRRRPSAVVYGRGAWDLQYNDTAAADFVDAYAATLRRLATIVAADGEEAATRLVVYVAHANHANTNFTLSARVRAWLNACRSEARTLQLRALTRCAVADATSVGSGGTVPIVAFDVFAMSAAPAAKAFVDSSGHHFTGPLLRAAARKLGAVLTLPVGSGANQTVGVCPRDLFDGRRGLLGAEHPLCGRDAYRCHIQDGGSLRATPACTALYG